MKKIFFLMCFAALAFSAMAQNCDGLLKSANNYYNSGKYVEASKIYGLISEKCGENYGECSAKLSECNRIVQEDIAYRNCTNIEECDNYLRNYPNGRYVAEVNNKRSVFEAKDKYNFPVQTLYFKQQDCGLKSPVSARWVNNLIDLLENRNVNKIILIGYATPDEEDPEVCAEERARNVKRMIDKKMLKDYNIVTCTKIFDCDELYSAIISSDIKDKESMIAVIKNRGCNTNTIFLMNNLYPEFESILEKFRRVDIYVK